MPSEQNVKKVEELASRLEGADNIYLTDFTGLNVAEMSDLRAIFRKAGIEYFIAKNTLLKLAAEKVGRDAINPFLAGPTAIAIGRDDPIAPAKIVAEYSKKIEKPKFKSALIDGTLMDPGEIARLAKLPSREVLLTQLVSTMMAPIVSFANLCAAPLRSFVVVLSEIAKLKEGEKAE